MEWQQLTYFRVVAEMEHVTRAAAYLAVSQSAVSRAISQLEAELGVPLFLRQGRNVALSRYGRVFLQRVIRSQAEIENGRRELADLVDAKAGTICLGFLRSFGIEIVPPLIKAYRQQCPDAQFVLVHQSGEALMEQLQEGKIDLMLSSPAVFQRAGVCWAQLFVQELVVAMPAAHRFAARREVDLQELRDEPFVALRTGFTLRSIFDKACQTAGMAPKIAFEGPDIATLRALISAGLGVGVVPRTQQSDSDLAEVPLSGGLFERPVGLAWMEDHYLSPCAMKFRDFVTDRYAGRQEIRGGDDARRDCSLPNPSN